MAIPPGPGSKPNPLHGDAFAPQSKPVTLPHMPPKPEAPTRREPSINPETMLETTKEEMETGRTANDLWAKRAEAEHEAGRQAVARRTARDSGDTLKSEPKQLEHKD
jgi:hypothetical protein